MPSSPLSRFYFDDGKTRKFWFIQVVGSNQTIRTGNIGAAGRETTTTFASPKVAKSDMKAKIEKRVNAGYIAYAPDDVQFRRKNRFVAKTQAARVKQFEEDYSFRIPDEYREFLLQSNGGYPKPGFVSIPGHPHILNVSVESILGLDCQPADNIRAYIEETSPALPKDHFPIVGCGDLFSISMKKNKGAVYYWDINAIDMDDVDENGDYQLKPSEGYLVASSFHEFMTRLAIYPNDTSSKPTNGKTNSSTKVTKKKTMKKKATKRKG